MQKSFFIDSEQLEIESDLQLQRPLSENGRSLGVVSTPQGVVSFMVELAGVEDGSSCRILEPACGDAPFLAEFHKRYGSEFEFVGVDIHNENLSVARERLPRGEFILKDYLGWQSDQPYDIIIGNPPYGIIGDETHYPIHILRNRKSAYKKNSETWHGKYNIYGAFIEHSVKLLKPGGKLVFVIPASWLVLDDFHKLRLFLARSGMLSIYYLGKAFPGRSVFVVVLVLDKGKHGLQLFDGTELKLSKERYDGAIIRFEDEKTRDFENSGVPLEECFRIYFAARSPEIRKNRSVVEAQLPGCVPILTGRNLHRGCIDYDRCYSGYWMPHERAAELRAFYGFPHLVVAHTKGTAVVCAVDERCYPWREEFHLVAKTPVSSLTGIMEYLNSDDIQNHVKQLYREFVPHLTSVMLRRIPIPRGLLK